MEVFDTFYWLGRTCWTRPVDANPTTALRISLGSSRRCFLHISLYVVVFVISRLCDGDVFWAKRFRGSALCFESFRRGVSEALPSLFSFSIILQPSALLLLASNFSLTHHVLQLIGEVWRVMRFDKNGMWPLKAVAPDGSSDEDVRKWNHGRASRLGL